jgi:hypothetical protein
MNKLAIINPNQIDISKPGDFAEFVAQAKALQNSLEAAWGVVEQQMLDRSVNQLKGDWGTVSISEAELLVVEDASQLDPAVTKPALDTKKVRAYRELMGALPAGVATKTISKFTKRIKG